MPWYAKLAAVYVLICMVAPLVVMRRSMYKCASLADHIIQIGGLFAFGIFYGAWAALAGAAVVGCVMVLVS